MIYMEAVNNFKARNLKEAIEHGTMELPCSIHYIEVTSDNGNALYKHWHSEFEFFLLVSGSAEFHVEKSVSRLFPGDAVFIPPYCLHEAVSYVPCSFYAIVFQPHYLFEDSSAYLYRKYIAPIYMNGDKTACHFHSDAEQGDSWEQQMCRRIKNVTSDYCHSVEKSALLIKAELLICWNLFYEHNISRLQIMQKDSRITGLIAYLEEHYAEDMTLKELAGRSYLSEGQLSRIFKQQMGTSIITYLNRIRMIHACQLLTGTNKKIADIANSCGFNNISHFNRVFHSYLHCSPREYRSRSL